MEHTEALNGREPAYRRVYRSLKEEILNGTYPVSGFLPKESELETIYQVSRTTVRKAVKMLSEEGLVHVRQGSGTSVCGRRTAQDYNSVTSLTESFQKSGRQMTTGSMVIDTIRAGGELAGELQLAPGTPVTRIQRIQLADGHPVTIMENFIPSSLVPEIETYEGKFVALYQFLEERYQIHIDSSRARITAASASFLEAQILQTEPKAALLIAHRVCFRKEKPVCVDHVRILGSQYEIEIRGQGRA